MVCEDAFRGGLRSRPPGPVGTQQGCGVQLLCGAPSPWMLAAEVGEDTGDSSDGDSDDRDRGDRDSGDGDNDNQENSAQWASWGTEEEHLVLAEGCVGQTKGGAHRDCRNLL